MNVINHPEPVPPASQMAVLPFLSAIEGLLSASSVDNLRLTIHRVMSREGQEYLQQICQYLPMQVASKASGGRTFPVNEGIMGAAYESQMLYRTRFYETDDDLRQAMDDDKATAKSWIAMPLLGPDGQVVLIFFAECNTLNFFADDNRVAQIVSMANGFCRLHDYLQDSPFANLRNFPLQKGTPNREGGGVYGVQEPLDVELPKFRTLTSFNYEATAA
ncbi:MULTISPECIES: hypothetical protein [Rhizobium]|uniref:hypothetical protein n=1 Tax=Rhizobium TaxID=379 RepID=UPI001C90994A|nr:MULTISPECIES: hypothetical protein [Rhizobium]MBY3081857.1 hypothetical protein [Rhizobium laguerreae]MBY3271376.1 hypothetical protein [Rhizobium laguerreae]MBY3294465.1 hypothetical protein [Rhizobium laguerreae]MBY3327337.1 hypothetical protein [Rhizobium laguerreae]MBY3495641.1 hypothetical protein [Rhizobium laguerreae]